MFDEKIQGLQGWILWSKLVSFQLSNPSFVCTNFFENQSEFSRIFAVDYQAPTKCLSKAKLRQIILIFSLKKTRRINRTTLSKSSIIIWSKKDDLTRERDEVMKDWDHPILEMSFEENSTENLQYYTVFHQEWFHHHFDQNPYSLDLNTINTCVFAFEKIIVYYQSLSVVVAAVHHHHVSNAWEWAIKNKRILHDILVCWPVEMVCMRGNHVGRRVLLLLKKNNSIVLIQIWTTHLFPFVLLDQSVFGQSNWQRRSYTEFVLVSPVLEFQWLLNP